MAYSRLGKAPRFSACGLGGSVGSFLNVHQNNSGPSALSYVKRTGLSRWRRLLWLGCSGLGLLLLGTLFWWGNTVQQAPWVQPEGVYFMEADAYSRMTRVAILAGVEPWQDRAEARSWPWVRWHGFENAPDGTYPHTTAPMDWAILGLWWLMGRGDLDRAGWWISPLLGVLCLGSVWAWSGTVLGQRWGGGALPFRWGMLFLLAASPLLWHGWAWGRPDHQALLLVVVAWVWMAEINRWRRADGGSSWSAILLGLGWGLAFWISWFEPLVLFLLATVLGAVWAVNQGVGWKEEVLMRSTAILSGILVAAVESPPRLGLEREWQEYFGRWAEQIGELQGMDWVEAWPSWVGWSGAVVPAILLYRSWRGEPGPERAIRLWWFITSSVLAGLATWHVRWGYFLVLATCLALPWAWGGWKKPWLAGTLFVLGLWPWAVAVDKLLEPDAAARRQVLERVNEARHLRQIALALRGGEPGAVVAPWWLTPPLVYWSGRDGVGGSSHQSLPGIVRSARFFLGGNMGAEEGQRLREAGVRYVVVGDSKQAQLTSEILLGAKAQEQDRPWEPGEGWVLWGRTPYFTIWQAQ